MHEHQLTGQNSHKLLRWTARILLITAIFATCVTLKGQAEFNGWAINPKVGIGIGTNFGGVGAGLEFNLITNQSVSSFDVYLGEDTRYFFGDNNSKFRQVGIMFGKYTDKKHIRIMYQGGLAPTWGILRGYYTDMGDYVEPESFMTIGLVGKLGLKIVPSHNVSLGIDLQGNLNLKNPMFMPSISIEFGKLRARD